MVDPLSYFSFQPVVHDKGCGMCCPVCGMMDVKEPLLLIGKTIAHVVAAGFLSCCLSDITVNKKVLCALLNKTFPSFRLVG